MKVVKVEGNTSLGRDTQTGAIVNTDRQALLDARKRKNELLVDKRRIEDLELKVNRLEALLEKIIGDTNDAAT